MAKTADRLRDLETQVPQLLARIEALEMINLLDEGWQRMGNAPTNGSRFLAFVPPYGISTAHHNGARFQYHSVLNKDAVATYWRNIYPPTKE